MATKAKKANRAQRAYRALRQWRTSWEIMHAVGTVAPHMAMFEMRRKYGCEIEKRIRDGRTQYRVAQ